MTRYLLDTNVISEFAKPLPDPNVLAWLGSLPPPTLYASVITLGELWLGVESLLVGKRRSELEHWMTDGLIAATAMEHDLTLVTRNEKDFRGLPLTLLNPWQA